MNTNPVKQGGYKHYMLLISLGILLIAFIWPRFLLHTFGLESPWTSYLYKYGFGAVFFFLGVFIVLKGGACDLRRGQDRYWFRWLIFGFFWYLILHGLWIVASISIPFLGEG